MKKSVWDVDGDHVLFYTPRALAAYLNRVGSI